MSWTDFSQLKIKDFIYNRLKREQEKSGVIGLDVIRHVLPVNLILPTDETA